MLDFSWSHILILLIVALVVVGPKDLPRLMRIVGQWMGKARAMADEFRKSFDEMARQSELDELRKEIENLRNERPLAGIEHDLNQSIIPDDMKSAPVATITAAEPLEVESPPEPRIGEFPDPVEPEPEPVAAGGYTPPQP
ncbi:MAG TPA: Sec-independent protein translocase protein TatB [Rhizomicrobium sp.]